MLFRPRSMSEAQSRAPAVSLLGESALLVTFPNRISEQVNSRVHHVAESLRRRAIRGVIELVPAYTTLLVTFDPAYSSAEELTQIIGTIATATPKRVDASE